MLAGTIQPQHLTRWATSRDLVVPLFVALPKLRNGKCLTGWFSMERRVSAVTTMHWRRVARDAHNSVLKTPSPLVSSR